MTNKLFPFQEKLIQGMLNSSCKHLYNACEQGLGKTIQALTFASRIDAKRVLIICPASLRLNWEKECIAGWYNHYEPELTQVILPAMRFKKLSERQELLITSYDKLVSSSKFLGYLLHKSWDLIILDEAHYIKNFDAKRTKYTCALWQTASKRVLCLSGTPMKNSAEDVFVPFRMITRDTSYPNEDYRYLCSNHSLFLNTFTKSRRIPIKYRCKYTGKEKKKTLESRYGIQNVEKFKELQRPFLFRKKKKNVLPDLPKKIASKITISDKLKLDGYTEHLVNQYLSKMEKQVDGLIAPVEEQEKTCFATTRRKIGEQKAQSVETIRLIKDMLYSSATNSMAVFFYHTSVREILAKKFRKYGISFMVHDGKTSPTKKEEAIKELQNGRIQILLAQVEAAVGYTITRADTCMFIEYAWTGAQINQAVDRLHRIGQVNRHVLIYFLLLNGSIDKRMLDIAVQKQKAFNEVY